MILQVEFKVISHNIWNYSCYFTVSKFGFCLPLKLRFRNFYTYYAEKSFPYIWSLERSVFFLYDIHLFSYIIYCSCKCRSESTYVCSTFVCIYIIYKWIYIFLLGYCICHCNFHFNKFSWFMFFYNISLCVSRFNIFLFLNLICVTHVYYIVRNFFLICYFSKEVLYSSLKQEFFRFYLFTVPLICKLYFKSFVKISKFLQSWFKYRIVINCCFKYFSICLKSYSSSMFIFRSFCYLDRVAYRNSSFKSLSYCFSIPCNCSLYPFRKGIYNWNSYSVKPSWYFIVVIIKFSSRMKHSHYNFKCRLSCFVHSYWDSSSVIYHFYYIIR